MVVDERARHELHGRLEQVLGSEEAATLMSHLPPVGWADVVTKRDLDVSVATLGSQLRQEMAELRGELKTDIASVRAEFKHDLAAHTRTLVLSMTSVMLVLASLAFGAARLM